MKRVVIFICAACLLHWYWPVDIALWFTDKTQLYMMGYNYISVYYQERRILASAIPVRIWVTSRRVYAESRGSSEHIIAEVVQSHTLLRFPVKTFFQCRFLWIIKRIGFGNLLDFSATKGRICSRRRFMFPYFTLFCKYGFFYAVTYYDLNKHLMSSTTPLECRQNINRAFWNNIFRR